MLRLLRIDVFVKKIGDSSSTSHSGRSHSCRLDFQICFIARCRVGVDFLSAGQHLFITGIRVMVPFRLLQPTCQFPMLFITGIRMCMLFLLTHEIALFIETAVFQGVLMFLDLAFQFLSHCIAVFCVMMSFGLFLTADQILRVAAVIMLVSFDAAQRLCLHCNGR